MPQETATKRVALVTGASTGIGAAIAVRLAREGFDVAISATRSANLASTLAALKPTGARALAVTLDVRSPESMERAMGEVLGAFGRLDVLVNNAAVTLRRAALEMTREEWQQIIDTNLTGAFFMSQQLARHLVAAKRPGCIVSLASTHGLVGFPRRAAYGISKAAVMHMTRMLAIEWAEHGIRVNAVAPGTVETPSRAAMFAAEPGARAAMIERVPVRRFGTAEEVAEAVCYLVSPSAEYITGQTLVLDGGLTAY